MSSRIRNARTMMIQVNYLKTFLSLKTQASASIVKGVNGVLRLSRFGLQTVKFCLLGWCVGHTVIHLVGYPAQVTGRSMQPTLRDMDMVWVNCWRARSSNLSRGDVVVYVSPKNPNDHLIKRLKAVEGTVVKTRKDERRVTVPEGHIWVEGDNAKNTVDSNDYGPVSKALVFGVATRIIWPPSRCQPLLCAERRGWGWG